MIWYTVDSAEEENAVREVILIMTEASWSTGGGRGVSLLARLLLSYSYISSRTF
jgi:hypothetical protein